MTIIEEFLELAAYAVPSGHEHDIRALLRSKLEALGLEVSQDAAFPETDSGNLYAFLPGTPGASEEPVLFSAHMDTVTPCEDKRITVEESGLVHTDGTTILGSDDISGIVEILAALRRILREGTPHRPIEIVFSASEEYFVEGAKRLDYGRIRAKEAYIMDTDGPIGRCVIAAPTGIRVLADIKGKASHAALAPEDGINAILAASAAIAAMPLGQVDSETTANIGIIRGGSSGNIVPADCFVEGETRSLKHELALKQAETMRRCFEEACEARGAEARVTASIVYHAWETDPDAPMCKRFSRAAAQENLEVSFERACGGSDASFIAEHGIRCAILATGMHEIHSVREYTTLQEMERMARVTFSLMADPD